MPVPKFTQLVVIGPHNELVALDVDGCVWAHKTIGARLNPMTGALVGGESCWEPIGDKTIFELREEYARKKDPKMPPSGAPFR